MPTDPQIEFLREKARINRERIRATYNPDVDADMFDAIADRLDTRAIPVGERLPEPNVEVLAWFKFHDEGDDSGEFWGTGIVDDFGEWNDPFDDGGSRTNTVTHWMPMPSDPPPPTS